MDGKVNGLFYSVLPCASCDRQRADFKQVRVDASGNLPRLMAGGCAQAARTGKSLATDRETGLRMNVWFTLLLSSIYLTYKTGEIRAMYS